MPNPSHSQEIHLYFYSQRVTACFPHLSNTKDCFKLPIWHANKWSRFFLQFFCCKWGWTSLNIFTGLWFLFCELMVYIPGTWPYSPLITLPQRVWMNELLEFWSPPQPHRLKTALFAYYFNNADSYVATTHIFWMLPESIGVQMKKYSELEDLKMSYNDQRKLILFLSPSVSQL